MSVDVQHLRPRSIVVPTIAAVVGLLITISACIWQYGRGLEKDLIAAQIEAANAGAQISVPKDAVSAATWTYRNVRVLGEFVPGTLLYHDNQVSEKRVGYNVYTALRISGSAMHCLIKRGWVAATADRSKLPEVPTPSGEVEISGLALPAATRFLELSSSQGGQVWQNVTVDRVAKAFSMSMQPFVIEQRSEMNDALERKWSAPTSASAKHYGYAFQWAGMAALIAVFYGFFYVRRRQRQA